MNGLNDITSGLSGIGTALGANFAQDPNQRQYYQGQQQTQADEESAQRQALFEQHMESFENYRTILSDPRAAQDYLTNPQGPTRRMINQWGQIFKAQADDPSQVDQMLQMLEVQAQFPNQEQGEGYSLSPGQTRFDDAGNPVASLPGQTSVQDVVGPIFQKLAQGEQISGGEQQALELWKAQAGAGGVKVELSFNPDGTLNANLGGGTGGTSGGVGFPNPSSTQLQDTTQNIQAYQRGIRSINGVLDAANQPGSQLGLGGLVNRLFEEVGRVGKEAVGESNPVLQPLAELAGVGRDLVNADLLSGTLSPAEASQFLVVGDINTMPVIEGALAYLYAKSLQPDGKLLQDTINTAKEAVKLQSWKRSEQTTVQNLLQIKQYLAMAAKDTARSVPGVSGPEQEPTENQVQTGKPGQAQGKGNVPGNLPPGTKLGPLVNGKQHYILPDGTEIEPQ